MKLTTKQTNRVGNHKTKGFTLIEMIGVLAVIAILAAVLVPKVFTAINNSRINNAAMSCNTVKTAIADHYAKAGGIAVDASGAAPVTLTLPVAQFDLVLIKEAFLDKPFAVKIGNGVTDATDTRVQVIACPGPGGGVGGTDATGYNLDGVAATGNEAVGTALVEAVITGVAEADAQALSALVDGPALSTTAIGTSDTAGRVKYTAPAAGATTTVYVYLTHR